LQLVRTQSVDAQRQNVYAMRLSLGVGVAMLIGKSAAYYITGSAAILSDAAESVVHVVAVAFAAFSLHLSTRPANQRFPYGYGRIAFFSAGFEGGMFILAAISIIAATIDMWHHGLQPARLGLGTAIVAAAAAVNGALGWYLMHRGRVTRSLILEANGRHVLTDVWTSGGVVIGLCLVLATGWLPFDPIIAIVVALNILWSGGHLVWRSVGGLMDYTDPGLTGRVEAAIEPLRRDLQFEHHGLRVRSTGYRILVEVHLLFPFAITLGEGHRRATVLEGRLAEALGDEVEVVTHLESAEDHSDIHGGAHRV
jgi:cation diffusion facilitator family transporter